MTESMVNHHVTALWQIVLTYCSSSLAVGFTAAKTETCLPPSRGQRLTLSRRAVKLKPDKEAHVPSVSMSVRPGLATWCCWMVW